MIGADEQAVWPDAGIKSNPNFPIVAQKEPNKIFLKRDILKGRWKNWSYLCYFKKKFVAKNFIKSANLVTLPASK